MKQEIGNEKVESPPAPCLKKTVLDLIKEFLDSAELEKSLGYENSELAFKACAQRLAEVFQEFGNAVAASVSAPRPPTALNTARAHALPSGRKPFIGISLHDERGIAQCAITVYPHITGAPVMIGDPDLVKQCAATVAAAMKTITKEGDQ